MCQAENDKHLLRTEAREVNVELHLGSHGELHRMKKDATHHAPQTEKMLGELSKTAVGETVDLAKAGKEFEELKSKTKKLDMCDEDFTLGDMDQNGCKSTTASNGTVLTHTKVRTLAECHEAAAQGHAHQPAATAFLISESWFRKHPVGCFAYACTGSDGSRNDTAHAIGDNTAGVGHTCYFFNEFGADDQLDSSITGTPICKRDRFLMGTSDTRGTCPLGYGIINKTMMAEMVERTGDRGAYQTNAEWVCREALGCKAITPASYFLPDEVRPEFKNEEPAGCFQSQDGVGYYNMELNDPPTPPTCGPGASDANKCQGTPVCMVDVPVVFGHSDQSKYPDPAVTR